MGRLSSASRPSVAGASHSGEAAGRRGWVTDKAAATAKILGMRGDSYGRSREGCLSADVLPGDRCELRDLVRLQVPSLLRARCGGRIHGAHST